MVPERLYIEQALATSYGKANQLIALAEEMNLLQQINHGRRNRKYTYRQYVAMLSEGTELSNTETLG